MVKLFSKNSNLCDHNPPTSQTERRTDRQTTCDRNTALCTLVHRAVKKIGNKMNDPALCLGVYQGHVNRCVTFDVEYRMSETVRDRGLVPKDHQ